MRAFLIASVVVSLLAVPAWAGPTDPGGTFADDDGNFHEGAIEAIALAGITTGCGEDRYCPASPVTRGQMATFVSRSLGLPAGPDAFADDDGHPHEADIDRLAAAGITTGCGGASFCPDAVVTRQEMASFIVRGWDLAAGPDAFGDDNGSVHEPDIDALAAAGVTNGCGGDRYCPHGAVRRDEMASFLARVMDLELLTPPPRCSVFPADSIWNTRIDTAPVHPRSAEYIAAIGAGTLHPDFGSGVWPPGSSSPIGIPYVEVGSGEPLRGITYVAYGDESDPGPFPIPLSAPVEGGPGGTGDRHVIVVDTDACRLYELYRAFPVGSGWEADSGATWDMRSNSLRPAGWTSADAAGLPIYAGLVRYDEVASGRIDHAIRFTSSVIQDTWTWPARHRAGSNGDLSAPPMGQRLRLRADFDISGFHADVQVILRAMREYGLVLADFGSSWYVSGAPDERWDNQVLRQLRDVPGSAFEAVDISGLQLDPDSGRAG